MAAYTRGALVHNELPPSADPSKMFNHFRGLPGNKQEMERSHRRFDATSNKITYICQRRTRVALRRFVRQFATRKLSFFSPEIEGRKILPFIK